MTLINDVQSVHHKLTSMNPILFDSRMPVPILTQLQMTLGNLRLGIDVMTLACLPVHVVMMFH